MQGALRRGKGERYLVGDFKLTPLTFPYSYTMRPKLPITSVCYAGLFDIYTLIIIIIIIIIFIHLYCADIN